MNRAILVGVGARDTEAASQSGERTWLRAPALPDSARLLVVVGAGAQLSDLSDVEVPSKKGDQ